MNDENSGIVVREGNNLISFASGTHYLAITGNDDFAFNWLDELDGLGRTFPTLPSRTS